MNMTCIQNSRKFAFWIFSKLKEATKKRGKVFCNQHLIEEILLVWCEIYGLCWKGLDLREIRYIFNLNVVKYFQDDVSHDPLHKNWKSVKFIESSLNPISAHLSILLFHKKFFPFIYHLSNIFNVIGIVIFLSWLWFSIFFCFEHFSDLLLRRKASESYLFSIYCMMLFRLWVYNMSWKNIIAWWLCFITKSFVSIRSSIFRLFSIIWAVRGKGLSGWICLEIFSVLQDVLFMEFLVVLRLKLYLLYLELWEFHLQRIFLNSNL